MLEVALLLKEVGLLNPTRPQRHQYVPLVETIEALQACSGIRTGCCRCTTTAIRRSPRLVQEVMLGLFRLEQGTAASSLGWELTRPRSSFVRGVRAHGVRLRLVPRPRRLGRPWRRAEL